MSNYAGAICISTKEYQIFVQVEDVANYWENEMLNNAVESVHSLLCLIKLYKEVDCLTLSFTNVKELLSFISTLSSNKEAITNSFKKSVKPIMEKIINV